MKKALVTGGAGFIGTNLIKKLLENKIEVVSLDDYSTGSKFK
jgi:nucleoside-diphosphate-sugar epimerase